MAVLIDAIDVKRRTLFEIDNTPFSCLEAEVNTPTARGGQTLVRLKIRNLLTNAVFEKTFKAGDKFKEPDLQTVPASYLYSDGNGSHFLDQESYRDPHPCRGGDRERAGLPDRRARWSSCSSTTAIPSAWNCRRSSSWQLPPRNRVCGATRRAAA